MSAPIVLADNDDAALGLATNIKVAFFDIDGTLLGLDGTYTSATKSAITHLQAKGIKTAIASGRPFFTARFIAEELGLADVGVFCTGAHLYSPKDHHSLSVKALPLETSAALIEALRASGMYYELYTQDEYYVEREHPSAIAETHAEHMRQAPKYASFDHLIVQHDVVKLLIAVDNTDAHADLHALEKDFPQCHFAYAKIAAYPDWLFASIIDKRACKHDAFDELLAHYDVSADEVMSFGDAQSDMVFLSRAGSGVAMGNASQEVQAVARYVTKPVWEDGVAYAISRLIGP